MRQAAAHPRTVLYLPSFLPSSLPPFLSRLCCASRPPPSPLVRLWILILPSFNTAIWYCLACLLYLHAICNAVVERRVDTEPRTDSLPFSSFFRIHSSRKIKGRVQDAPTLSFWSVPHHPAAAVSDANSLLGCFTCRLRRKKCDEAKPYCRACRHLGVRCEYKRPSWWTHPEHRRQQKEVIKSIIKQTKLQEKPAPPVTTSISTPPSLCHSVPTSDTCSDSVARGRGVSVESQSTPQMNFDTPRGLFYSTPMMPPCHWTTPVHAQFPYFPPFEVDIKTEIQTFADDVPTLTESAVSTFAACSPSLDGSLQSILADAWTHAEYFENREEPFTEALLEPFLSDFTHESSTRMQQAVAELEEQDRTFLDHFLENVAKLIFPLLEANHYASALSDVILPALESNKCYLHCCLSISALHMKATHCPTVEQIDNDIMRHRVATISELCDAFNHSTDHSHILEATLAMILFQSSVGLLDDSLPDVPWYQHFQAATSLVETLELQDPLRLDCSRKSRPSFNMTLTSWIDILGATMSASVPVFAHTYRHKAEAGIASGLAELMGCEDRVMYLISEISCLEALKNQGMDVITLCTHIAGLGEQLTRTETSLEDTDGVVPMPDGAVWPKQLIKNITTVFRLAARIHLCSLVPDFERQQGSITSLVDSVTSAMALIPDGQTGFDRCLVWPLLIAGSASLANSSFRTMFAERCNNLAGFGAFGSFGRVSAILNDVWRNNDRTFLTEEKQSIHWRDAMRKRNWDALLI